MKRKRIKRMILDIIGHADYDLAKAYDPESAEEPELVNDRMDPLIAIVKFHLKKAK